MQQLALFARNLHLTTAIVRHIAADDDTEWCRDLSASTGKTGRRTVDFLRSPVFRDTVDCRDMTEKVGIGLSLLSAIETERAAGNEAGMDVGGDEERRINRWPDRRFLPPLKTPD